MPYVGRFKTFEMPLLGFAGYLPFGVECLVLAELVERIAAKRHKKRKVCANPIVEKSVILSEAKDLATEPRVTDEIPHCVRNDRC